MTQLVYSETELFAEHPYARPQIEAGYRLHGGFDEDGRYLSPRTFRRGPAVEAWRAELARRGFPLIDATTRLLQRGNYPSFEQQRLLLDLGLGQTLWNSLTRTGVIEARGLAFTEFVPPDFQAIIEDDISTTCTGHLGKGLLKAHGFDEGGRRSIGEGGHDTMWFAVRDLLFGKDAYPMPEIPENIARPELGRLMPLIPLPYEQLTLMLMNVLMIEIRAEAFFRFCVRVMRAPELFTVRREAAEHAADLVERIRQDEAIHVAYLQTTISELRSFTFRAENGERLAGETFIDPVWNGMVRWHSVTTLDFVRNQVRDAVAARLAALPDGVGRLAFFDSLEQKEAA
jgi:hypothetical protein